jgi:predicted TIM-barrel fold metal-dependent hydrolase
LESSDLVDCHTHVVSPDKENYPLNPRDLSGKWYLEAPASGPNLAASMDDAEVAQAILVQGVGAYTYDNRYAADAAAAAPARFASACAIDVEASDAVATLEHWIQDRGMHGVRLFALSREGPSWLTDPSTFPIWQRAAELAAHVIVTILPHQLDELDQVLGHFSGIDVSLDHCGFALADADHRERLFELARHRNLHLKISTHNLDDAARIDGHARALIRSLVAQFGADRLMWGSDFCQTHDRSYEALVALARDAFSELDPSERTACFSETPRRLWPHLAH